MSPARSGESAIRTAEQGLESLLETTHLLQSRPNARRLEAALRSADLAPITSLIALRRLMTGRVD